MSESEEVSLVIDGEVFKANKSLLCEYSDYFRAMFSGNYVENEKREITIDVVEANSMGILLKYMEMGFIDLSDYDLPTTKDILLAANFLQVTELIKQIEYILDINLSITNWMETLNIAEAGSLNKLERLAAAFGLFSFNNMVTEYVPTLQMLYWYLSHPYLDTENEFEVFKFGYQWITQNETGVDALLIILGCLDINRLTVNEVKQIKNSMTDFQNSLAAKVVDLLDNMFTNKKEITKTNLQKEKQALCESFTERAYNELLSLVSESPKRKFSLTPAVPMWIIKDTKPQIIPHNMYTYTEGGFEKWVEVQDKDVWGWSVTSWGRTKLVVVCGERGRGSGMFVRDVKVYDTLRDEWVRHGVELPMRRHGGVAVLRDELFIIGGVGGFRVVLDSAIIYDLNLRTYRKIEKFPEFIQNPAVCAHRGNIYAAGQKNIYRYEDMNFRPCDRWNTVVETEARNSCMVSYKEYIYCTQNYFNHLFRFRPDVDKKLELITYFTEPPATICNLGDRLIVFTRTMCGQSDNLSVEAYAGTELDERPRVLWSEPNCNMVVNDVGGSSALVMSLPPLYKHVPNRQKRYLSGYVESDRI